MKKVTKSEKIEKVVKKAKAAETAKAPVKKATKKKAASAAKTACGKSCDCEEIPHHEIAIRAYYISERRIFFGGDGNAEGDWHSAIQQIVEERTRQE